jgi:hypothetical protein
MPKCRNAEMPKCRNAERLGQVVQMHVALGQAGQDGTARGVGQGGKVGVERIAVRKHEVI